jgi:peptidoglycan hydrolase-like protein with peptidoglycan-binding domain
LLRGRLIAIFAACCAVLVVVPTVAQARTFGSRTLKRGSRGSDVRTLQRYLTKVGFTTAADGIFGSGTQRIVRTWEGASALRVDGRVTRADAKVLRADVAALPAVAPPALNEPVDDPESPSFKAPAPGSSADASTGGAGFAQGGTATLNPDGTATPPDGAPEAVQEIILAGNAIAKTPYVYGGGHGKWQDSGYDCSGSVSYALHGAGLLKQALDSTSFESWGSAGPGAWVTIYANGGHAYMVVAGLRFDTSGAKTRSGSRWTDEDRSNAGFVVRHPAGL